MYLSEVPGYNRIAARASRLEDAWRDFAFVGATEKICGIEVNLLTLRMFVQLCAVRSPFLCGGPIGPEDVALFLWRLSPEYVNRSRRIEVPAPRFRRRKFPWRRKQDAAADTSIVFTRRAAFVASIAHLPFARGVRAIERFLNRMLIDKPPSREGGRGEPPDISFAAAMIHQLASTYGWTQEEILDTPMPRLFQYLRQIQRSHDPKLPRFNPIRARLTKKLMSRALEEKQRQLDAEAAR